MWKSNESYSSLVAIALFLTLGIIVAFQVYIDREPERIAFEEKRDILQAANEGEHLYNQNCAMCHGAEGEGVDGPPLNDSNFLNESQDNTIFSLIASGVPGTEMPAWGQAHGGPFTDQQINALVIFIRQWEPDAPDRIAEAMRGDPVNGLQIYQSTCVICHGPEGVGTDLAPELSSSDRLTDYPDEWFIETIASGRPAAGMPTWGTVVSPIEIRDLVALLRAWQRGEEVKPPGAEEELSQAIHMLGHGEFHEAEHHLENAMQVDGVTDKFIELIQEAIDALKLRDEDAAGEFIFQALEELGVEDIQIHQH